MNTTSPDARRPSRPPELGRRELEMLVDLLSDAALAELTAQCDEAARRMEQRSLTDPTKAANAIRITIRYRRIASWLRWRTSR